MSSASNMNMVLNQGSVVKEMYNVKKQSLEPQQQINVQVTQEKRHENKSKIDRSQTDNRVEPDPQGGGKDDDDRRRKDPKPRRENKAPESFPGEDNLIDILA